MLRCSEAAACRSKIALPLPADQPGLGRTEKFLGVADQGGDQLAEPIAAACRDRKHRLASPQYIGEPRSILLRTIQVGASLSRWLRVIDIGEPQHEIRFGRTRARAPHAFLLDGIVGLANAGGVDDRHRIAVEIELHLDDVARGAGMRRDDRDLAPRELIHQRRLADIRRTRDGDHEPVAQAFSSALRRKHFRDFAEQRFDLRERRRDQFGRAHRPRRRSRCRLRSARRLR